MCSYMGEDRHFLISFPTISLLIFWEILDNTSLFINFILVKLVAWVDRIFILVNRVSSISPICPAMDEIGGKFDLGFLRKNRYTPIIGDTKHPPLAKCYNGGNNKDTPTQSKGTSTHLSHTFTLILHKELYKSIRKYKHC